EFNFAAHPRASGYRQRARLQVACQHARGRQIDRVRGVDVAFELAADDHGLRAYLTGQLRARLDRQVALYVYVAVESSGNSYVATALDLAFDRESGCDHGFLQLGWSRHRHRPRGLLDDGARGGVFVPVPPPAFSPPPPTRG